MSDENDEIGRFFFYDHRKEVNTIAADVPVQPNVRQNALKYPRPAMPDENDEIGRFFCDDRKRT
ncbi:hypothetical protein HK104_004873, partial [Borealophlyctis nickersoniae]